MENHELEKLLVDLESDRVERKSSFADRDKICQTICAFANDLPNYNQSGVLFIGADDDGHCTHLDITDELLCKIADLRTLMQPFASMSVQKRTLCGGEMVVVIVSPSYSPPVRYQGRTWVRVGHRRAIATPDEERRLTEKRRFHDMPFDIRPIHYATLNDLDLDLFQREYLRSAIAEDILEQNERSVKHHLMALRFATTEEPIVPTILGILVVGTTPCNFIPGAYIQFVRFEGTEITDPIKDQKEISGTISEQFRTLDMVFKAHISVSADITASSIETRSSDYPLIALQQLARNAVLHRTYESTNAPVRIYWFEDRIEILSPGGPFGNVNQNNFGQRGITDYRNQHLAGAMRDIGYIQRFGVGIELARRDLERNGNLPPEFVISDTHVLVILRRKS